MDLVRAFGGPESTHRADDDVAATCMVYRVLLAAVATLPQSLICAIGKMSEVEEWNTAYVFRSLADPEVWEQTEASAYNLRKYRKETLTKDLNLYVPTQIVLLAGYLGKLSLMEIPNMQTRIKK